MAAQDYYSLTGRFETMKLILRAIPYDGQSPDLDLERNAKVCVRGDEEIGNMRAKRRKDRE